MTQTPGISTGTEVVADQVPAPRTRSAKRPLKMVGAGLVSAALVGVFALPAYATTSGSVGTIGSVEESQDAYAQALTTSSLPEIAVPAEIAAAEEEPVVVEPTPAAAAAAAEAPEFAALPAGSGVEGIVNAAVAQLGMDKDCTDVAQDALAAVGLVTSRYAGGPDLGVQSFASFGTVYSFSTEGLAPGDLLVYPGIPHVAVYIGGGQVVHGGWHPTQMGGYISNGVYPEYVVRVA